MSYGGDYDSTIYPTYSIPYLKDFILDNYEFSDVLCHDFLLARHLYELSAKL